MLQKKCPALFALPQGVCEGSRGIFLNLILRYFVVFRYPFVVLYPPSFSLIY